MIYDESTRYQPKHQQRQPNEGRHLLLKQSSVGKSTVEMKTAAKPSPANPGGSLPVGLLLSLLTFALITCGMFVYHELHYSKTPGPSSKKFHTLVQKPFFDQRPGGGNSITGQHQEEPDEEPVAANDDAKVVAAPKDHKSGSRKGELICNGNPVDSEIIYWKIVDEDLTYESPITPHHGYVCGLSAVFVCG